ncbi:MAG: GNAT family N-acetyltransferase [Rothia sp. (in: high G+C Gram-positive bacteria)]|nr:GNAT family N-acetyltransferase [Rothia sp. (in: high G+C Gram-positive bacteria)]
MSYTLRPATLADAPALSAFASAHFPDSTPPIVSSEHIEVFVSENLDEASFTHFLETGSHSFTLAVDKNDDIIAYAGIDHTASQPDEVPGDAAYLSKFYLSAETRGTGLARELMQSVISEARADGKDGLHLRTPQLNHRAQAFYEKVGFSQVGECPFHLTETVTVQDYIYHLPL